MMKVAAAHVELLRVYRDETRVVFHREPERAAWNVLNQSTKHAVRLLYDDPQLLPTVILPGHLFEADSIDLYIGRVRATVVDGEPTDAVNIRATELLPLKSGTNLAALKVGA